MNILSMQSVTLVHAISQVRTTECSKQIMLSIPPLQILVQSTLEKTSSVREHQAFLQLCYSCLLWISGIQMLLPRAVQSLDTRASRSTIRPNVRILLHSPCHPFQTPISVFILKHVTITLRHDGWRLDISADSSEEMIVIECIVIEHISCHSGSTLADWDAEAPNPIFTLHCYLRKNGKYKSLPS